SGLDGDGNQLPSAGETACPTYFAKRLIQQGGAGGFACRSNGHNQRSHLKMNKFPKTVRRPSPPWDFPCAACEDTMAETRFEPLQLAPWLVLKLLGGKQMRAIRFVVPAGVALIFGAACSRQPAFKPVASVKQLRQAATHRASEGVFEAAGAIIPRCEVEGTDP